MLTVEINKPVVPDVVENYDDGDLELNHDIETLYLDSDKALSLSNDLDNISDDMDTLENVSGLLEKSLEDGGDGISDLTAGSISVIVNSIKDKSGFNVDSVSRLVSTENYGPNISNRRRRTEIAYEGIGDAIKGIGNKIADMIKAVIKFLKDFWNKHISIIGRLKKKLEKLSSRIDSTRGHSEGFGDKKVPGALKAAFPGAHNINDRVFGEVAKRHDHAIKTGQDVLNNMIGILKKYYTENSIKIALVDDDNDMPSKSGGTELKALERITRDVANFGSEEKPLVAGNYGKLQTEGAEESDEVTVKVEWLVIKRDNNDNEITWDVGDLNGMKSTAGMMITLIDKLTKLSEITKKITGEFEKALSSVNGMINKHKTEKSSKDAMSMFKGKLNRLKDTVNMVPKLNSKLTSLSVKLVQSFIVYSNQSLDTYVQE